MHKHGYFHRDIKPENLLMQSHQGLITKIADFGLARELRSRPPYTEYISTRWYRAPEVILHSTHYSSPIDLWALGCILAEMYLLQPLFPGTSEIDQLYKITQCLGPIQATQWKEGWMLVNQLKFRCPSSSSSSSVRFPTPLHSKAGFSFITNLIVYDPSKRLTAPQALRDPYFKDAPEFSSLVLDHDYILVGGRSPLEWKADPPSPVPALSPYSPSLFSHALPSKVSAINTSLPPLLAPRTSPPLSSATLPSPSLPTPHSSSHPNHAMFALPPLSPISHQRLDALLSDLETSPIHPKPALTFKKSPIKAVTSTATTSTERRSSHTFPKVNQSYFSGFKRFW
ncbi:hypothetical protein HMI55_004570 [Coelomomyces lativittatus]|nr:hypothetical protein HMI55_004570 [Coelomomyces lativittatus]